MHIRKLAIATLMAGLWSAAATPAHANLTYTLDSVDFADGGTASGNFSLNISGYVAGESIITTAGLSGSPPFPGVSYSPAFQVLQNQATNTIIFQSTSYVWSLVLQFAAPLGTAPVDALVAGGGTPGNYTGSYEQCEAGAGACGGIAYQDVRFITDGAVDLPEPASAALLALAAVALAGVTRRQRTNRKR